MIPRFKVILDECGAWLVRDNMAHSFSMPIKAVSLFFKNQADAEAVADIMNKEWFRFLTNPE